MRRNKEFTIGIAVATLFVILVWLVLMFGKQSFPTLGEEYTLIAQFDSSVPGIEKKTAVNMNGIRIGRVASVMLVDNEGKRYAEVKLMIRKEHKTYMSDICRISSPLMNLSGNISLEIVRDKNYKGPQPPPLRRDGETIPGAIQSDFMQSFNNLEEDLNMVLQNVGSTAKKFETFIDSINAVIGTPQEAYEKQQRFQDIIDKAGEMMVELNHLAINVNALLGDEEVHDNIRAAAREFPGTLSQVRNSLDNFNEFSRESRLTLNRVSQTLDKAEANLDNLESFTEVLGEEGAEILRTVSRSSRRLEGMFNDISTLMLALQNPDGSLGQLVNNPELYNSIQQTVTNVAEISETLRPIVSDFRILSDKLARDPGGHLGIRGAISPAPPLKGLPLNPSNRTPGIIQASHNTLLSGIPRGMAMGMSHSTIDPELEMIQRQNLVQRALFNASQRQLSPMQYGRQAVPSGQQGCLSNLLPKLSFSSQPDYAEYETAYDYGYDHGGCGGECGGECGTGYTTSGVYDGMENDFTFDSGGMTPSIPAPQIGSQLVAPSQSQVAPAPHLTLPQPTDQLLLPPTILEFGPINDTADPLEVETSAVTYSTQDRGFVLEFETPLPQTAQTDVQLVQVETDSQKEKETNQSPYAPQVISSAPVTQPQPKPPTVSESQYGSVRRGVAR